MENGFKRDLRNYPLYFLLWTLLGLFYFTQGIAQGMITHDQTPRWRYLVAYLCGVVVEERFLKTLARAKTRIRSKTAVDSNQQIIGLLETIAAARSHPKRLAVRSVGQILFVNVADIDWMQAAENYVELHTGSVSRLLHVTMNALEKSLDPEMFIRVHRSIIVNLGRIATLQPGDHGEYLITLRDGMRLQSGRAYSDRLRALINNPF